MVSERQWGAPMVSVHFSPSERQWCQFIFPLPAAASGTRGTGSEARQKELISRLFQFFSLDGEINTWVPYHPPLSVIVYRGGVTVGPCVADAGYDPPGDLSDALVAPDTDTASVEACHPKRLTNSPTLFKTQAAPTPFRVKPHLPRQPR